MILAFTGGASRGGQRSRSQSHDLSSACTRSRAGCRGGGYLRSHIRGTHTVWEHSKSNGVMYSEAVLVLGYKRASSAGSGSLAGYPLSPLDYLR